MSRIAKLINREVHITVTFPAPHSLKKFARIFLFEMMRSPNSDLSLSDIIKFIIVS